MLVLSAMLAPENSGDAATSRACCDELLAKMPAPQATVPTTNATSHEPAAASTAMPSTMATSEMATFDDAPARAMRCVAQMLPAMPATPNSTSASDSVLADGSSSAPMNGAM